VSKGVRGGVVFIVIIVSRPASWRQPPPPPPFFAFSVDLAFSRFFFRTSDELAVGQMASTVPFCRLLPFSPQGPPRPPFRLSPFQARGTLEDFQSPARWSPAVCRVSRVFKPSSFLPLRFVPSPFPRELVPSPCTSGVFFANFFLRFLPSSRSRRSDLEFAFDFCVFQPGVWNCADPFHFGVSSFHQGQLDLFPLTRALRGLSGASAARPIELSA